MRIVAATGNAHKIEEIGKITGRFGFELIPMRDAGVFTEPEENGETFEENSYIKAAAVFTACGEASLADDSGLCVDALGGAPGVHSARYGGEHGNDALNRKKLLEALKDVPDGERTARFICVITLLLPGGEKLVGRGECPGRIIREERGEGGFGYDSLFVPDGFDQTFAELPQEVKNTISHRANALAELERLLAGRAEKDLTEVTK